MLRALKTIYYQSNKLSNIKVNQQLAFLKCHFITSSNHLYPFGATLRKLSLRFNPIKIPQPPANETIDNKSLRNYINQENAFFDRVYGTSAKVEKKNIELVLRQVEMVRVEADRLEDNTSRERVKKDMGIASTKKGIFFFDHHGLVFQKWDGTKLVVISLKRIQRALSDYLKGKDIEWNLKLDEMAIYNAHYSTKHKLFSFQAKEEGSESDILIIGEGDSINLKIHQVQTEVFNSVLWEDQSSFKIFYTLINTSLRPFKLLCWSEKGTETIFNEDRNNMFLDVGVVRDKSLVTINCNTLTGSEIRIFTPKDMSIKPKLFHPYEEGIETFLDSSETYNIILTQHNIKQTHQNANQPMQIYLVPKGHDGVWFQATGLVKVELPDSINITDVEIFDLGLVVYGTDHKFNNLIWIYHIKDNSWSKIEKVPQFGEIIPLGSSLDFHSSFTQFQFSSPIQPNLIIKLDLVKSKIELPNSILFKCFKVTLDQTGYLLNNIKLNRIFTNTKPEIPITLISSENTSKPLILISYGAYGVNLIPKFQPHFIPLLKDGYTIALAHIRGGSELGPKWYTESCGFAKLNGVKDLIQCAEYLQKEGYGKAGIITYTTSAGAVSSLNAVIKRPELFSASLLRVPFLNPYRAMMDSSLPLTNVEVTEWTTQPDQLKQITPKLDKLPKKFKMFVLSGFRDNRVSLQDHYQFVANLRRQLRNDVREFDEIELIKENSRLVWYTDWEMAHAHMNLEELIEGWGKELAFLKSCENHFNNNQ